MNKELTPIQELMEWVKTNPNINISNKARVIEIAKSLLPKEKQGYEDAFNVGFNVGLNDETSPSNLTFNNYYNTKYNNNENN